MLKRFGSHFRHNVVAYIALFFAIPAAHAVRLACMATRRIIARGVVCALALVCAASVSASTADAASAPGSLDLSFDGDGKAVTEIGSATDQASAVAVQEDGRVVVAGFSQSGTGNRFAVVRYKSDGSLDTSFDGDGRTTTAVGTGSRDEA
ncbi:MAG: delta-60 repeat domain-containing protein, partial [Actinomycetota bacterium]|nr:delta-60 repeat domain-containing protein [Actinomycetota bacterium]